MAETEGIVGTELSLSVAVLLVGRVGAQGAALGQIGDPVVLVLPEGVIVEGEVHVSDPPAPGGLDAGPEAGTGVSGLDLDRGTAEHGAAGARRQGRMPLAGIIGRILVEDEAQIEGQLAIAMLQLEPAGGQAPSIPEEPTHADQVHIGPGGRLQHQIGQHRAALHVDPGGPAPDDLDPGDTGGRDALQGLAQAVGLGSGPLAVDQHIARGTGISPDTLAGVDGETRNALNQIQRRAELAARKVGGIIDGHITGGGGCGNGRHRSGQGGEKGRERY